MAKKAKAAEPVKKRSTASVATQEEGAELGSVGLLVETSVTVTNATPFDEIVIEWRCMGLSEEPDSIKECSPNPNYKLDPKRPVTTSSEGLHLYFDPMLPGPGTYGFQFLCTYNEAVSARVAKPEDEAEAA